MSKINKIKIGDVSYDIQDLSIGDLNNLSTEDKTSVVNAINEVLNNSGGNGGNEITELYEDTDIREMPSGIYVNRHTSNIYVTFADSGNTQIRPSPEQLIFWSKGKYILTFNVGSTQTELSFYYIQAGVGNFASVNVKKMVSTTGSQTIEGQKTFTVLPVVTQDPTEPEQLASKAYVDVTVLNAIGTALGGEY